MVFGIPANCHSFLPPVHRADSSFLRRLVYLFTVRVMDYDESIPESLKGKEIAEYLSAGKQ